MIQGVETGSAVSIAAKEFKVKRAVGIEIRRKVAIEARRKVVSLDNAQIIVGDIRKEQFLMQRFYFSGSQDPRVIEPMQRRFRKDTE